MNLKFNFSIIFILFYFFVYSQDKSKIIYDDAEIYGIIIDNKSEIIEKSPLGRNVTIFYDTFFKSYYITFDDVNGIRNEMTLSYIATTDKNNLKLYKDDHPNSNFEYYIIDLLEKFGTLLIYISTYLYKDYMSGFLLENAIIQK